MRTSSQRTYVSLKGLEGLDNHPRLTRYEARVRGAVFLPAPMLREVGVLRTYKLDVASLLGGERKRGERRAELRG